MSFGVGLTTIAACNYGYLKYFACISVNFAHVYTGLLRQHGFLFHTNFN